MVFWGSPWQPAANLCPSATSEKIALGKCSFNWDHEIINDRKGGVLVACIWNMEIQWLPLWGSRCCMLGLSRRISACWKKRVGSSSTQLGFAGLSHVLSWCQYMSFSSPAFTAQHLIQNLSCGQEATDVLLPPPEPFLAVLGFRELFHIWHWALQFLTASPLDAFVSSCLLD